MTAVRRLHNQGWSERHAPPPPWAVAVDEACAKSHDVLLAPAAAVRCLHGHEHAGATRIELAQRVLMLPKRAVENPGEPPIPLRPIIEGLEGHWRMPSIGAGQRGDERSRLIDLDHALPSIGKSGWQESRGASSSLPSTRAKIGATMREANQL